MPPSLRIAILASTILAAGSIVTAEAAVTNYSLLTTVSIPATAANNQGGKVTGFDISYVDPLTGIYYFADRSNASVDIINGATNKVIAQAGGFAGQLATTSISGPDGVVVVNNGTTATLYAGDGNSLLRSFNVTNPSNPIAGGVVNTGGGQFRLDELAYSPSTNQLFTANNANQPAFAALISTASALSPSLTKTNITVPGQVASGGLEQSVWNPNTGTFFVSVPTFNGTDSGGVQEFSTAGAPLRTYNLASLAGAPASCTPSGLAIGASGNLLVGCASGGPVVLNPAGAGSIVRTIGSSSGADELWYDPVSGNFFVTGTNSAGHRVIDVVSDATGALLQSIDLTAVGAGTSNLHSVAVDPLNGEIFVPITGSTTAFANTLCPSGCVAVFAQNVPEPASLPLLAAALAGVFGLTGWMRRRA